MKETKLQTLTDRRKAARWPGFANIGDFHQGKYDCNFVSPWTKSASNFDSGIMLIAQDWASADYLNGPFRPKVAELGYDPSLETNINLQELMARHLSVKFADTYATNLFPFVKVGGMSANIPASAYRRASIEFLAPQIEIVAPRVAICIGLPAFRWACEAMGKPRPINMADAIANPITVRGTRLVAVAHTGRLGMNNRGRQLVEQDWTRLKELL